MSPSKIMEVTQASCIIETIYYYEGIGFRDKSTYLTTRICMNEASLFLPLKEMIFFWVYLAIFFLQFLFLFQRKAYEHVEIVS